MKIAIGVSLSAFPVASGEGGGSPPPAEIEGNLAATLGALTLSSTAIEPIIGTEAQRAASINRMVVSRSLLTNQQVASINRLVVARAP